MKPPKYFVETMQQCIDLGLNGFAFELLAESFAVDPAKFGDENVCFLMHGHNGQEVYLILTKKPPALDDFDKPPEPPRCTKCNRGRIGDGGYCDCELGKDLKRVETGYGGQLL